MFSCGLSVVIKLTLGSALLTLMWGSTWWGGIRLGSREKIILQKPRAVSTWCEASAPGLFWLDWAVDRLTLLHAADRKEEMQLLRSARPRRPTTKQLWCSFQKPRLYSQTACSKHGPVAPGAPRKVPEGHGKCELRVKVPDFKAVVNVAKSAESNLKLYNEYD